MDFKPVRKAVFPVAGLGTRFLPATKAMPKEMLTVVDKPLIQYAVEEALEAGVEQIIFVTGRGVGALVRDTLALALWLHARVDWRGSLERLVDTCALLKAVDHLSIGCCRQSPQHVERK